MTELTAPLGVYGGTFDPIHHGHLEPVCEAAKLANIDRIAVIPCHIPPHKAAPDVTPEHRLAMVRLACQDYSACYVDERELNRHKPSYTVDTLSELRQQFPDTPLCFFIGTDSLNSFDKWKDWQGILKLAHLVVSQRDTEQHQVPASIRTILAQHQCDEPSALHHQRAGAIWLAPTEKVNVSSTEVRQRLLEGSENPAPLPESVARYIRQHGLYRRTNPI